MAFQLTNIASALERAEEAISWLLDRRRNERLPEEEQLLNVIDALQRIEHIIRKRWYRADQLKGVQMNFMIEIKQGRATQDTNSDSDCGHSATTSRSVFFPALTLITMVIRCGGHRQMGCRMLAQWWGVALDGFVCLFGFVFVAYWIMLIRRASSRASCSSAMFALGALVACLASLPRSPCFTCSVWTPSHSFHSLQRLLVVVVFLVGLRFFVVFAWFGLVSQLSLCFFACLRSFTDWCIAHRQQSREQKKVRGGIGPPSTSESYQATSEQLPFQWVFGRELVECFDLSWWRWDW